MDTNDHPVAQEDALGMVRSMAYLVITACEIGDVSLFKRISAFFMTLAKLLRSYEYCWGCRGGGGSDPDRPEALLRDELGGLQDEPCDACLSS